MIAIDDLNDWVGALGGHPLAKTPNLDRFARASTVVFQNAHCPGPVCGPSRSAILSGFMPHRTGLYGNRNNMIHSPLVQSHFTLPEYFSSNGYITLSRGKIAHVHRTNSGMDYGHWMYDQWERARGGAAPLPETITCRDDNIIWGSPGPQSPHTKTLGSKFSFGIVPDIKETRDFRTAQWASTKLQEDFEQPFFLAVGIHKPHLPFNSPREFWDLFPPEKNYVPPILPDDLDDIVAKNEMPVGGATPDYLWLKENDLLNDAARAYLACVAFADHCIGIVLDGLENSPHAENTIVIIWGDHGWHLGEKLRYRKATLWSEATRSPLMIRVPGKTTQQECNRAVNLIDIYPTLIELCGLPDRDVLDGRSLLPLLNDAAREWYPTLTISGPGEVSVHDERWNYVERRNGIRELYDLESDPLEWNNLASSPEHVNEKERLSAYVPRTFADATAVSKQSGFTKTIDDSIKTNRQQTALK